MKICSVLRIILLYTLFGCSRNLDLNVEVKPKNFKIRIPFEVNNRGIIIDTYWGADKIKNKLLWDNDSPTWANEKVIGNNKSISMSKTFSYSTTTADGTPLNGNVYNCDSISVGQLTFTNVPFYKIPDQAEGAFGENLISKGVWEINFRNREMIFASSIDFLKNLKQAELFTSNFTNDVIKVSVSFGNNTTEEVAIDFGFNDGILLPYSDFLKIENGNSKLAKKNLQFSTPTSKNILETTEALDTIQIQNKMFSTIISTNNLAREKVIGRAFFEAFEFVIFDYQNKLFYVSKNRK